MNYSKFALSLLIFPDCTNPEILGLVKIFDAFTPPLAEFNDLKKLNYAFKLYQSISLSV